MAFLLALPVAAEGQQVSVNVYARVIPRVETQELLASGGSEDAAARMPAGWSWEVRGSSGDGRPWAAPVLASGRGGAGWPQANVDGEAVSYLFAPL